MKFCCEYDDERSWGDTPQGAYDALFNHLLENEYLEDEIPPPDACIFYKLVPIEVELRITLVEV